MTDTLDLALKLISLGWKVFPVNPHSKRPLLDNGFLGASDDSEEIATWFSGEFSGARIGVATGASNIVVADLDRKNEKDGFSSVDDAWLELPSTFSYPTPNGGEHKIYRAPADKRLTGNADYRKLPGFDRRAGGSYIVFWCDHAPESLTELTEAPSWLTDEASERPQAAFGGRVADWVAEFGQGEPNKLVVAAIERFPQGDMSHSDMVSHQYNLIRLGAEGNPGVLSALESLRTLWLERDPALHGTPEREWDFKFDEALNSGIQKYGEAVEAIRDLPDYAGIFANLPDAITDLLIGEPKAKKHYFSILKTLVKSDLPGEQIASVMWNAPTVKTLSREWGIEYLYEQIDLTRHSALKDSAPKENPTLHVDDVDVISDFSLLDPSEAQYVSMQHTFIDHYIDFALTGAVHINKPYHRACAWEVLSLTFGMWGFLMENEGALGVNMFILAMGESSTGKTRAIKVRDPLLKEIFGHDESYDLGGNPSPEYLHEKLVERDGKACFLNADEAASVFATMTRREYALTLEQDFARYFEGYVPPVGKKSSKSSGTSAMVSFSIGLFGTPEKTMRYLTESMYSTGFIPRFIVFYGDPPLETDDRFKVSRGDRSIVKIETAPATIAMAASLKHIKGDRGRIPVHESDEAIERLERVKKDIYSRMLPHPKWKIIEPSVTRLGDYIRKAAALLAMSEGLLFVELRHMLCAIKASEEWLAGMNRMVDEVSANDFQRDVSEIVAYVQAQGGGISESRLAHRFRNMGDGKPRDFQDRVWSAKQQGMLNEIEANQARGTQWVINGEAKE